jgi:hypothetical protein
MLLIMIAAFAALKIKVAELLNLTGLLEVHIWDLRIKMELIIKDGILRECKTTICILLMMLNNSLMNSIWDLIIKLSIFPHSYSSFQTVEFSIPLKLAIKEPLFAIHAKTNFRKKYNSEYNK